jgi:hypothetical protein
MSSFLSRITSVVKAAYNFFVGDAVILIAVTSAFVVGEILIHALSVANPIAAIAMITIIVAGLAATLGRERAGRR